METTKDNKDLLSSEQRTLLTGCAACLGEAKQLVELLEDWAKEEHFLAGTSAKEAMKRHREIEHFTDKVGKDTYKHLLIMLYFGRDVSNHSWFIQKPNGDYYVLSVCQLLRTEEENYERYSDPSYLLIEKSPKVLKEWMGDAIDHVTKAAAILH
jgi:hypothetical protein